MNLNFSNRNKRKKFKIILILRFSVYWPLTSKCLSAVMPEDMLGQRSRWMANIKTTLLLCALLVAKPPQCKEQGAKLNHSLTHNWIALLCYRFRVNLVSAPECQNYTAVQSQKAVSAYITNKQILHFVFAVQHSLIKFQFWPVFNLLFCI